MCQTRCLSFLHRWDYCWKCEFDTDVKIEKYYHHDGKQLGFYKTVHIKRHRLSKRKDVLAVFVLQETNYSNLFDKKPSKSNAIFSMKKVNLDES